MGERACAFPRRDRNRGPDFLELVRREHERAHLVRHRFAEGWRWDIRERPGLDGKKAVRPDALEVAKLLQTWSSGAIDAGELSIQAGGSGATRSRSRKGTRHREEARSVPLQ